MHFPFGKPPPRSSSSPLIPVGTLSNGIQELSDCQCIKIVFRNHFYTSRNFPGGFSSQIFEETTLELTFSASTMRAIRRSARSAAKLQPSAKHQQTPIKRKKM